jgi:hypothetical protein
MDPPPSAAPSPSFAPARQVRKERRFSADRHGFESDNKDDEESVEKKSRGAGYS